MVHKKTNTHKHTHRDGGNNAAYINAMQSKLMEMTRDRPKANLINKACRVDGDNAALSSIAPHRLN